MKAVAALISSLVLLGVQPPVSAEAGAPDCAASGPVPATSAPAPPAAAKPLPTSSAGVPATQPPAATASDQTCAPARPTQASYDKLRARFQGDLAEALSTESRLTGSLNQEQVRAQALTAQIRQQRTRIATFERQIRELDRQMVTTQARIDVEKAQVGALARALYRRPESLPLLLAKGGSLRDALQLAADLMIAGERAHGLQTRLEDDLGQLAADRRAREGDRVRAETARRDLENNLRSLNDMIRRQGSLIGELQNLIGRIRLAAEEQDQPPAVMSVLAAVLENLQRTVVLKSYQLAAHQVSAGAGLSLPEATISTGKAPVDLHLSSPLPGGRLTQPFGPTDFWLAPPLGAFEHFHTGLDLAAPEATPVLAAADGTVASVTRSNVGYGNYVIVEHGPGLVTLYGHLLDAAVKPGDRVRTGQPVGYEGSSGFSTGAHLHFELRVNEQFVDPLPFLVTLGTQPSADAPAAAGNLEASPDDPEGSGGP